MYAIVETGGKQYRVEKDSLVKVEKLPVAEGEKVVLEKILAVGSGEGLLVGSPYLEGAKIIASVQRQGKGKKIIVFKYKPKKNYRRKQGHRQLFTELLIEEIQFPGSQEAVSENTAEA